VSWFRSMGLSFDGGSWMMVLSVYILRWGMVVICSASVHLDVTCEVSVHGGHTLLPCSMVRHASPFRISRKDPSTLAIASQSSNGYTSISLPRNRAPIYDHQLPPTSSHSLHPLPPSPSMPITPLFKPSPHLTLTSPPI